MSHRSVTAVVIAQPALLADALSRVLQDRGVKVCGSLSAEGDVDLAVVDGRGLPNGLTARVVAVIEPTRELAVDLAPQPTGGAVRITRVHDLYKVLDDLT